MVDEIKRTNIDEIIKNKTLINYNISFELYYLFKKVYNFLYREFELGCLDDIIVNNTNDNIPEFSTKYQEWNSVFNSKEKMIFFLNNTLEIIVVNPIDELMILSQELLRQWKMKIDYIRNRNKKSSYQESYRESHQE
jgi:hypothetical protein